MANTTGHVIDTWVTEVGHPEPRFASDKWTNIAQDRKQIYSYGSHFPMARYMNDENGEWFLVNGDQYSVTTSIHQGHLRAAVRTSGLRSMIVPFSALREAQIDLDSIRYVYIGEDTYETVRHEVDDWSKLPHHMKWVTKTRTEVSYRVEPCKMGPRGSLDRYTWEDGKLKERHLHEDDYPGTDHFTPYTAYSYDEVKREPDSDGMYRWERSIHHLGASVFTARYQSGTLPVKHWRKSYDRDAMRKRYEQTGDWDWEHPVERRYYYTENQPVYSTAYFLSAFDEQESPPLYFLAQLPEGSEPQSVNAAFEALKPELVKNAEAHSRVVTPEGDAFTVAGKVTRQGDVFAIPVEMSTAELKAAGATPVVTPPPAVDLTKLDPERYQEWRKRFKLGRTESWVLGVNHTATETMVMPKYISASAPSDEQFTYARGTLRHRRVFRDFIGPGEHKRQRMGDGKTWHLLVKNTVPYVHGESRAWTVGGGVD